MDVSIAVSLIRGQMGAVVERAVNGAVETVLAEMLKVVGVKFEELKSQVALMKRDMETLQREKAIRDKENDNMRAKLRYTELKLKYYRQGVEEELQQRVSAAALSHSFSPTGQVTGQASGLSQLNNAPSCSGQTRTGTTSTSPQNSGKHSGRGQHQADVREVNSNPSNVLLPLVGTSTESLDNSIDGMSQDSSVNNSEDHNLEWTITLQPNTEGGAIPGIQVLNFKPEQQSTTGSSSSEISTHADSSTLHCSPPQVKQEPQQDNEVICIKEEPDEEQDETAMFNCQLQPDQASVSEVSRNVDWSGPQTSEINAAGSSLGSSISLMSQIAASMPCSLSGTVSSIPAQQLWPKRALGLSEEFKKHRKDQQRRSWMKCRELEKTLPQPLLSEILRERREKTRLRVAKWRAKKKLQEARARGGAAPSSPAGLPSHNPNLQLRAACGLVSGLQHRPNIAVRHQNYHCNNSVAVSVQPTPPYMGPSSGPSYSTSLFLKDASGGSHIGQHTVTSSSSAFPQVNATQQSVPLNDPEIIE